MLRYRIDAGDLAASRFAISPVVELNGLLRHLDRIAAGPVPMPSSVRRRFEDRYRAVHGRSTVRALALLRTRRHGVNFLTPPPASLSQTIEDDLAAVRATPPALAQTEIRSALRHRSSVPYELAAELEARDVVDRLADTMRELWDVLLAPEWPLLRAIVERDVVHRAETLTRSGWAAALADIHPRLRWRAPDIEVLGFPEQSLELAGRGLLFVPSVFITPALASYADQDWQPALVYPARGSAALWSTTAPTIDALDHLMGSGRARVLAALETGASTSQLARQLGASLSGLSAHLRVLHDAGLVTRSRMGRSVVYRRSALGDALVASSQR